jgi:hypothetical protein
MVNCECDAFSIEFCWLNASATHSQRQGLFAAYYAVNRSLIRRISILLVKRPEKVFNINCLVPEARRASRRKCLISLAFSAHFFLDNAIKNPAVAG